MVPALLASPYGIVLVWLPSGPLRTVLAWFLVVGLLGLSVLLAVANHYANRDD